MSELDKNSKIQKFGRKRTSTDLKENKPFNENVRKTIKLFKLIKILICRLLMNIALQAPFMEFII